MNTAQNLPVSSSPFQFNNLPIRTQVEENKLWFAAKDVCAALGIGWNGTTLSAIPDDWQSMRKFRTLRRGDQNIRSINEPAVYKLAFRSNKPEADAFTNWVASEVIPSIRKTGKYETALPHGDTLTATEQAQLQAIVQAKAGMVPADMQRKAFAEMWTRFNRHFRIARYAQLPPAKMGEAVEYLVGMEVKTPSAALPATAQPALPAAPENTEFLPTMFPTFEKDIMDIERLIERLCSGMSIFARPGSMMYSELVRNKQLIDAVQPCISAAKNAVGTGYFMMQTARKIYGAMK